MQILDFIEQFDIHSWQILSIVFIAAVLAGFINTFAGSGTAINYFLFDLLGLPISVSNGTVRLGVIMQSLANTIQFYRKNQLDIIKGVFISIPVTIGSVIGAEIAINIDLKIFEHVIGLVLLFMVFLLFYNSDRWIKGKQKLSSSKARFWHLLVYFIIGIYGGFIHIGVGVFLMIALVWVSGYNLVKAAAIKMLIVLVYTPFVFIIFALDGQVEYLIGFITGAGYMLGGIWAGRMALKWGPGFIRWSLVIFLSIFSLKLLGLLS